MSRKTIQALANFIGMAIGVGIFGIPFAFAKASFFMGLVFLIGLAGAALILNLSYGEVILRTTRNYQFVGYIKKYLGNTAKKVAMFAFVFAILGGLLAYIIISGDFLFNISTSLSPFGWSLIFAFVMAILAASNLRTISRFEMLSTIFFLGVIALIFSVSLPHIKTEHFSFFTNEFWFLPYGVVLFAYGSLFSVPIIRKSLEGEDKQLRKVLVLGMAFVAVFYLLFSLAVLGVSGDVTSPDAISGLFPFLGNSIVVLGSIFGLVAIATSFVMLSRALVDFFVLDYKFRRFPAWLMTVSPPLILFVAGLRRFIDVISLVGAVSFGLAAVLTLLMKMKAREKGDRIPDYALNLPTVVNYGIITLFTLGIIYALFFF
jgi:amino acid permease